MKANRKLRGAYRRRGIEKPVRQPVAKIFAEADPVQAVREMVVRMRREEEG